MIERNITVDGVAWKVFPSGLITQYDGDEYGLVFVTGTGAARRVRTTRYSPQRIRSREEAFAKLSDAELAELLRHSQPSETSPEAQYAP